MKKLLTISLLALSTLTSHAQTEATPFVPGSTLDGVNYFLPRTAFRIVVEAEKTVTVPGELNKYAYRLLRLDNVPTAEKTEWRLVGVTLEPYGVPDKTKAYNIKLDAKKNILTTLLRKKTVMPTMSLTNDGILLGINKDVEETTLPALPQGKEATAPLNSKAYMNQEMLTVGSTAKLAELCAQEIYDIRDSRNALTRGEADNLPKDGAQLKLMLDQLDLQSQAMEQLFMGYTQKSTHVFVLNVTPTEEGEQTLFRFSTRLGMLDADDLAGDPVYLSIIPLDNLPQPVENPETAKKKQKMERGIYYNVPAREAIRIYNMEKTFGEGEFPMGQFGRQEILSNALFGKNSTTKVSFYQNTGGVQKIEQ